MRTPEPLRDSPFRRYRRKSLYTGLYGTNYSGPTRPPGDITESSGVPIQSAASPTPKTYLSGPPGEYTPHPGPMQMPRKDYKPCDTSMVRKVPQSVQPAVPDGFPMGVLPDGIDLGTMHEHSRSGIDPFEPQIGPVDEQFNRPTLMPRDNTEVSRQFMKARWGEELSRFDRDLRAHMLEIQMAVEEMRAEPSAHPNPEPRDIGLTIPQDFFEQQERVFESQFRELEPDQFDYGAEIEAAFQAQEALFDSLQLEAPPMEGMEPSAGRGPDSLEQIVEAEEMPDGMLDRMDYDNSLMIPDLLEQEISEVPEPMESMEPYPDPFGHYGGMTPQEMYDEQMQQLMDPYMMLGMIDPYMMPGPFGPMLDPGPGGPP